MWDEEQLCIFLLLFLFQLERAKDRQRHTKEATQRRCADRGGQIGLRGCGFLFTHDLTYLLSVSGGKGGVAKSKAWLRMGVLMDQTTHGGWSGVMCTCSTKCSA
jgi:hypothetical protein